MTTSQKYQKVFNQQIGVQTEQRICKKKVRIPYVCKKGFTLLEMLAAMAMIAIVAGFLYTSLNTGFKAKKQTERILAPMKAAALAFSIMGCDLQSALPPRGILAGPFLGQSDTMSFFTRPVNTQDSAVGIVGVEYVLTSDEEKENNQVVLLRNIRVNLLSLEEPEPFEERLAYGISAFEIKYFDGTVWLDAWDSTTVGDILPVAVDVCLEMKIAISETEEEIHSFRRVFLLPCKEPLTGKILSDATGAQ